MLKNLFGKKKDENYFLQVEETVSEVKENVKEKVENLKEKVEDVVEDVVDTVQDKVEETKDKVEDKVEETKDKVEDKVEETKDKVKGKVKKAKTKVKDSIEKEVFDGKSPKSRKSGKATPSAQTKDVAYEPPEWVKAIKNYSGAKSEQEEKTSPFAGKYLGANVPMSRRRPGPSLNQFKQMVNTMRKK